MSLNAYQVLGIEHAATADEVKAAFRAAAQLHGAKSHRGDAEATERMKAIIWAWGKLKDPDERKAYDRRMGFDKSHDAAVSIDAAFDLLRRRKREHEQRRQEQEATPAGCKHWWIVTAETLHASWSEKFCIKCGAKEIEPKVPRSSKIHTVWINGVRMNTIDPNSTAQVKHDDAQNFAWTPFDMNFSTRVADPASNTTGNK